MSIFVPLLQTFICHGDFLIANISPNAEAPTVNSIQKAQHPDQLIVVWWMSHAELSSRGILQYPPLILMERYTSIFKCKLTEVHKVMSSTSTIHINAVKDIAFVFHLDVLEHELPNCAGMSRVFYTWYHYDIGNRLVSVDCCHHFLFSNIISENFPSHIWNSIIDIKEEFEKSLNDPKQYQLCKKTTIFILSLESWNYIYMSLVGSGAAVVYLERKFTHKYMQCDLSMCSQRGKQCLTLLRLDSIKSLSAA
jgi:hypothetical protein